MSVHEVSLKHTYMVHIFNGIRLTNSNVQILDIKGRICIALNYVIGLHNFFYVNINEVVVGINMLLNQSFGF